MNIKEKINEISDYFKNKVLEGDYEIISTDMHTCKIEIDNEYIFELWTGNNQNIDFDFYYSYRRNLIITPIINDSERAIGVKNLQPKLNKYRDTILKIEKKERIKELQKELEELNQ